MRLPWKRDYVERAVPGSVSDPATVEFFNPGVGNFSDVTVTESTALSNSAVWRALQLVSQMLAMLDVSAVQQFTDGTFEKVDSWLDEPGGLDGPTAFEFWEMVYGQIGLYGNAYLLHREGGAGQLLALQPVHPLLVDLRINRGVKTFHVTMADDTQKTFAADQITHIPGFSLDGSRGYSPLWLAKNSIGTALAADRAAAKTFAGSFMQSGMVTPEEDVSPDEVDEIEKGVKRYSGWRRAGEVMVTNRKLKYQRMTATPDEMQFHETRAFQIEDIARWWGVPPHLLMQMDKQTSWGTGVAEQNRGLARTLLGPLARRIEDRISRLLPAGQRLRFDFASLERPTPEMEIDALIKQVGGPIMTPNEARAVRNLPPVEGGDVINLPAGAPGVPDQPEDEEDESGENDPIDV